MSVHVWCFFAAPVATFWQQCREFVTSLTKTRFVPMSHWGALWVKAGPKEARGNGWKNRRLPFELHRHAPPLRFLSILPAAVFSWFSGSTQVALIMLIAACTSNRTRASLASLVPPVSVYSLSERMWKSLMSILLATSSGFVATERSISAVSWSKKLL